MKIRKIIGYSDKLMSGNRLKCMLLCAALAGTELFFRLAEASFYSILLYFGKAVPAGLFSLGDPLRTIFTLTCTSLRILCTAPLIYAAACRFVGICGENRQLKNAPLSRLILSKRNYRRSLAALLISKAVGVIFMIPTVFFGSFAYKLISESIGSESSVKLFTAVHAAVMTILSFGIWVWAKLSLMSVPFLMAEKPKESVLRLSVHSFAFMKGRRTTFVKLLLYWVPQMLFIATIPYALMGLCSAAALSVNIFMKEDEYRESNKACCNDRYAHDASKFSAWTKKRFAASSDKA